MQLPAHDFLDAAGIAYEKRQFPADTEKGAANVARALGFEERQMVKTLIFESGEGERVLRTVCSVSLAATARCWNAPSLES